MKKLLAITLTLVMLLGTIGISVSAEPNEIQNHFGFRPGLEHMPTYIMPGYEYIYSQDNNFVYCLNEDNTIHLVGYIGEESELVIPETIDGYTVSSIDTWFGDAGGYYFCIDDSLDLTSYTINYSNMKVTFPNTVTKLGLEYCDLKEIVIPEGVTEFGLSYCDTEKVTLFDSVKTLYLVGNKYIELLVYKTGTNELSQLSKDTVIYGVSGSYAEKYANEYGCIFVDIQKKLGDINNDTAINGKDVLDLRKYLIGLTDTINTDNADVNGDGKINGKDVLHLRKYLVGLVTWLGVNETPSDIVVETPDNL